MSDFIDHICEAFVLFGEVRAKRMFGGYGLFHEGVMIGLVDGETLYLKTDPSIVYHFTDLSLPPFRYDKKGKVVTMSYHQAPDSLLDDPQEAAVWAKRSYDAAQRAKQPS